MDELDVRLTAALLKRIQAAPARMYRLYPDKGRRQDYDWQARRGLYRGHAELIADYLEEAGVQCGSRELIDAAVVVKDVARNMHDRDRDDDRERESRLREEEEESERWASIVWASTTALAAHLYPRMRSADLSRVLAELGYLSGMPGSYSLTEKAISEGIGREVRRGETVKVIHWNKNLMDNRRLLDLIQQKATPQRGTRGGW